MKTVLIFVGCGHRCRVTMMQREVGSTWHWRQVMAAHGLFFTTDLQPRLIERGSNCRQHRFIDW